MYSLPLTLLLRASLFLLLFGCPAVLNAQEKIMDSDRARAIFEEMDQRRSSIDTEQASMQMVITDSRGRTRTRTLYSWTQNSGEDTMSLIVFADPGNVRGTAFLSISESGVETQRLYLPATGRIQLIGASERGDRFMGSDFTYEDLGDQSSDDFEFEWLTDNENYYTIRAENTTSQQYSSVEFDILKEKYAIQTVRYFDSEERMIKRLEAEQFEQLTETLWSASVMTMFDLRENRKTELSWSEREINREIEEWRFTERGLRRGI
ncbi:MAG: outer membrane lipoprotein-sorting protein [Balneolaceae bacterium]|nr:MAG: outer membrane lipoprotein-sorting protein [Balneolaceae bacterium]